MYPVQPECHSSLFLTGQLFHSTVLLQEPKEVNVLATNSKMVPSTFTYLRDLFCHGTSQKKGDTSYRSIKCLNSNNLTNTCVATGISKKSCWDGASCSSSLTSYFMVCSTCVQPLVAAHEELLAYSLSTREALHSPSQASESTSIVRLYERRRGLSNPLQRK